MAAPALHRFEYGGKRYALDTATCFCFETDAISWDVLEHYPHTPANRIMHLLADVHASVELEEVIGELEWLRATGAILPVSSVKDMETQFAIEPGLKRLRVDWHPERAVIALDLLLGRAGTQPALALHVHLPADTSAVATEAFVFDALRRGRLAGKALRIALHAPIALGSHDVEAVLELQAGADVAAALKTFGVPARQRIAALAKLFHGSGASVSGWFRVVPQRHNIADAVTELRKAGAQIIDLDLDACFVARNDTDPAALFQALHEVAQTYAQDLLAGRYYRLEPIAGLFQRIYQGTPRPRADGAGVNELAIGADGGIYASRYWLDNPAHRVGDTDEGLAPATIAPYENIGSRTTAACLACWAAKLCGGGTAAVHEARSGSFREPERAWCDAQRAWLEAAVAAFSVLSASGVDFNRVYQSLGRAARPSFFQIARAALRQTIGMRPLAEADAETLQRWGNWNEAAYFSFNESSVLMATAYDREMDSLHPRGFEHEFMVIRKSGTPMGLFKVRPELVPGTATAWFWLRDAADYADAGVRRSFRALLKDAAGQQEIRRLLMPASAFDPGLPDFLQAAGFEKAGTQREALYLHGAYHDVDFYAAALG